MGSCASSFGFDFGAEVWVVEGAVFVAGWGVGFEPAVTPILALALDVNLGVDLGLSSMMIQCSSGLADEG